MTDQEFNELVTQHGLPLVTYCSLLQPVHHAFYYNGDEDEDGPHEARLRTFMTKWAKEPVRKLRDVFGRCTHPPIDAHDRKRVYEFKVLMKTPRFQELDTSKSLGAFVERFKLRHLELACGLNLTRYVDERFFEDGYYVYMDGSMNVFALSVREINRLIESGKTIYKPAWGDKGSGGWMIPTNLWEKLGSAMPRRSKPESAHVG
jgi:hypothetical protein